MTPTSEPVSSPAAHHLTPTAVTPTPVTLAPAPADRAQHALVAGREIAALIRAGGPPQALAAYLDAMEGQARIAGMRRLSRRALGELYQHCASAPPLTLDEFLPASIGVGETEIFSGLNSLPLFRRFEKRFTRTARGTVIGFNFQPMSFLTGPGYFTVNPADNELLIDYTKVPTQAEAPDSWPKVKPNDRGLSRLVYKNLHDFCRRVSRDVFIGQATHLGKPIYQYFVLVRGAVT